MVTLKIPYNDWDASKDLRLSENVQKRAFDIVVGAFDVGDAPDVKTRKADRSLAVIDEVMKLFVDCTEWLREYGISAQELEQRFNSVVAQFKSTQRAVRTLAEYRERVLASDPGNREPIKQSNNF